MGEVVKMPGESKGYQRRPKPLLDIPVFNFTDGWDVPSVKSALATLEQGQFLAAAQLCDAMDRDDRIKGVLDTRVRALLGLEQQWGDPDDEEAKDSESVQAFREAFPQVFPDAQLADLLRWGIRLGVGLGELVWFDKQGRYTPTPRLKIWHPQFMYWRWDTRSFWVATQKDGIVEVTAGDGRWVLYTPWGEQRGWMQGLVRPLSVPYLIRQYALRDSARYSEAYGGPVKQGIVPTDGSEKDKERFLLELSQLANESTILTPQIGDSKFDFKLHELTGKGHEVFEAQLRRSDTNIAITILGQNMTTEAGTTGGKGALSTAKVHDRIRGDVLVADAKALRDCCSEQGLEPWSVANRGGEDVPEFRWETDEPEDQDAQTLALSQLSSAVTAFVAAKSPIDQRKLLEDYGLPLITPEEEAKLKAEAEAKDQADRQAQVDQAAAVAKAKGPAVAPVAASRTVTFTRDADGAVTGAKIQEG